MFNALLDLLNQIIIAPEPWKTLLISFVATIITCVSVIAIGFVIEKLENLEYRLLTKSLSQQKALFVMDRLTFPGTILHELSHALFAWATGAKVQKIKMITFFDSHRLGYVNFQPCGKKSQQRIQLALTSCAPVLTGIIALHIILLLFPSAVAPWHQVLLVYLFISIFNHMSMSNQDIKNYLRGLVSVFPIMMIFFYAVRLFSR